MLFYSSANLLSETTSGELEKYISRKRGAHRALSQKIGRHVACSGRNKSARSALEESLSFGVEESIVKIRVSKAWRLSLLLEGREELE